MGLLESKTSNLQKLKGKMGGAPAPSDPVSMGVPAPNAGPVPDAPTQPNTTVAGPEKVKGGMFAAGNQDFPPELKEEIERFVVKGSKLIHSPDTRDEVVSMLQVKEPIEAVVDVTVGIVQRIDQLSRNEEIELNDVTRAIGGSKIADEVIEVGEASGIFKLDDNQRQLVYAAGTQKYIQGEIEAGRMDPEKLKQSLTKAAQSLPPEMIAQLDQQLDQASTAIPQNTGMPSGANPTAPGDVPVGINQNQGTPPQGMPPQGVV